MVNCLCIDKSKSNFLNIEINNISITHLSLKSNYLISNTLSSDLLSYLIGQTPELDVAHLISWLQQQIAAKKTYNGNKTRADLFKLFIFSKTYFIIWFFFVGFMVLVSVRVNYNVN